MSILPEQKRGLVRVGVVTLLLGVSYLNRRGGLVRVGVVTLLLGVSYLNRRRVLFEEDAVSLNVVNPLFRPMIWGGVINLYAVYDTVLLYDKIRRRRSYLNRRGGLGGLDVVTVLMYVTCRR